MDTVDGTHPASACHSFPEVGSALEEASLTRIMWPVEMSMLDWTGSSDQEEVLLRAEGLGIGPSLNWEETLLMRDVCGPSGRSCGRTDIRWRHSSCKTARGRVRG